MPNAVLFNTFMCGIKANDWNTMLILFLRTSRSSLADILAISTPSIITWPRVGSIKTIEKANHGRFS